MPAPPPTTPPSSPQASRDLDLSARSGASSSAAFPKWLFPVFLVLAALGSYIPCLHGGFIWDDAAWTTNSEFYLRDLSGLWRIWTDPTAMQQYFPLTATSFWIDWHLWGGWTLPYHVENVMLHALSGILLWRVLRRLEVPGAELAAALFTLHPMMVESVAWITERKNTLSLVLMLAASLAYFRHREQEAGWAWWLISFSLYIAALLAKITAFIFPPALLLIFWWKNGRLQWKRDVRPTLPFFLITLVLGLLIHWLERHHVGAEGADFSMGFAGRAALAGHVFWFYPLQLLWPLDLHLFYPKWQIEPKSALTWIPSALAIAALLVTWKIRRHAAGRAIFVALFFYGISISPVLGFLNVYGMFMADVADRWVYVPSISLITLVAAGLHHWIKPRQLPWLVLLALIPLTWRHAGHYVNEETFWRAALDQSPDVWCAHNNLGTLLGRQGKTDEAARHLQRALELRHDYPEAWCNQANLLRETGRFDEALAAYREALRLRPDDYPDAHNNIGMLLLQKGQPEEAERHFRQAVEIQPLHHLAHNNLGNVYLQSGRVEPAIASYQKALEIQPGYPDAHNNLGMALLNQARLLEAIPEFEKAIQLRPGYAEAINNLGHAFLQTNRPQEAAQRFEEAVQGRPDHAQAWHNLALSRYILADVPAAIAAYEKAVESNPRQVSSLNNLAWILATFPEDGLRDGRRALELAGQAGTLTENRDPVVLHTLAAALAENRRFDEALQTARTALQIAASQNNDALVSAIREQVQHYEAGKPFRDAKPESK